MVNRHHDYAWIYALVFLSFAPLQSGCFFASEDAFSGSSNSGFFQNFNGPGAVNMDFINNVTAGVLDDPNSATRPRLITSLKVDSSGRILVAGGQCQNTACNAMDTFVARLNSDGTLDSSFGGGDGVFSFDLQNALEATNQPNVEDYALAIAVSGQNIAVVSNYRDESAPPSNRKLGMVLLNSNGGVVNGFGAGAPDVDPGFVLVDEILGNGEGTAFAEFSGPYLHVVYNEVPTAAAMYPYTYLAVYAVPGGSAIVPPLLLTMPETTIGPEIIRFSNLTGITFDDAGDLIIVGTAGQTSYMSSPAGYASVVAKFDLELPTAPSSMPADEEFYFGQQGGNSRAWGILNTDQGLVILADASSLASGHDIFNKSDSELAWLDNGLNVTSSSDVIQHTQATSNPFFPLAPMRDEAVGGLAYHSSVGKFAVSGLLNSSEIFVTRLDSDGRIDGSFGLPGTGSVRFPLDGGQVINYRDDWDHVYTNQGGAMNPFMRTAMLSDGSIIMSALIENAGFEYTFLIKLDP